MGNEYFVLLGGVLLAVFGYFVYTKVASKKSEPKGKDSGGRGNGGLRNK